MNAYSAMRRRQSKMLLVKVAVRYCVRHDGIANEDDYVCDFSRDDHGGRDGEPRPCEFRQLYRKAAR